MQNNELKLKDLLIILKDNSECICMEETNSPSTSWPSEHAETETSPATWNKSTILAEGRETRIQSVSQNLRVCADSRFNEKWKWTPLSKLDFGDRTLVFVRDPNIESRRTLLSIKVCNTVLNEGTCVHVYWIKYWLGTSPFQQWFITALGVLADLRHVISTPLNFVCILRNALNCDGW